MGDQRPAPPIYPWERPPPIYPWERSSTHCKEGLGGLRVGLNGCGKSRLPPGFDSRTVQPVVSRYNDYVIPAQTLCSVDVLCLLNCIADTIEVTEGRTLASPPLGYGIKKMAPSYPGVLSYLKCLSRKSHYRNHTNVY